MLMSFDELVGKVSIPQDADIVFVADMFVSDYAGGAEMSTEALIESSPFTVYKLHSKSLTMELLEQGHQKYWIFGNFSQMDMNLIPSIIANMRYSIVEYDYKFCRYRSCDKHTVAENKPCDCDQNEYGKLISAFFYGAKSLWWMSEKQEQLYHTKFPFLTEKDNVVLSSIFSPTFFLKIKELSQKYKDVPRNNKWIVLGSKSWIKGFEDAVNWCHDNGKEPEVIWDLSYTQVLEKLAVSEGHVYLPRGADTCPRLVIEAKLLGCQLHLNDNVQHAKEIWFDTEDRLDTESYLFAARARFWSGIKSSMEYMPSISGYTTTYNCISQRYPFEQCIESMLGFCDEVVVVDGGSTDGTWERLQELKKKTESLIILKNARDWNHPRSAVFDGLQKALARSLCTGDFAWQMDSDEVVDKVDYKKIRLLARDLPKSYNLVALPVVEYWGGTDKLRVDTAPWKWRISRNLPFITHGIPSQLRRFDENGDLYSLQGSDGCDYVRNDNYDVIPHVTFYTADVDQLRRQALIDPNALAEYQKWLNTLVKEMPTVYHFSWFNMERKINTYKHYWQKHWSKLFNIQIDDTADNNMFFDKPWSQVTDDEIKDMAAKLKNEMGGWIFHKKVDFSKKTPHVSLDTKPPEIMNQWIKENS